MADTRKKRRTVQVPLFVAILFPLATLRPQACASETIAVSSAGVSCGTSTGSDSDSTPPEAQILITSAPYFICRRVARRHSSGPLHTPSSGPDGVTRSGGKGELSQWPPVDPSAWPATNMRGPSVRPPLIALRRATSMKSPAPRSRALVTPDASASLALRAAWNDCSTGKRSMPS